MCRYNKRAGNTGRRYKIEKNKNLMKVFNNKKVLITGNTGFKGTWLTFFLNTLKSEIYGLSDKPTAGIYELTNVEKLVKKQVFLDLKKIDIKQLELELKAMKPDIIFHFAAQSLVKNAHIDPVGTFEINAIGTLKLLIAANNVKSIKQITIATTDKVYKNPFQKNTEDGQMLGNEFYSSSKVAAENVIQAFKNNFKRKDLNLTVIRSGNVIGGGDRGEDRITSDIVKVLLGYEKVLQVRNPKHIRPWISVLDSLYGYLLATEYSINNSVDEVFNLSSEINNQFNVEKIIEEFNKISKINFKIENTKHNSVREVEKLTINSKKATELLNWSAKLKIEEIIKSVHDWEIYHKNNKDNEFSLNLVHSYLRLHD